MNQMILRVAWISPQSYRRSSDPSVRQCVGLMRLISVTKLGDFKKSTAMGRNCIMAHVV
jgi:hypothetical protein